MITETTEDYFDSIQLGFTNFGSNHCSIHKKQYFLKWRFFRIQTWSAFKSQFFSSLFLHVIFHNRLNQLNIDINIFESKDIGLIHKEITIFNMYINLIRNEPNTNIISIVRVLNHVLHLWEFLSFLLSLLLENLRKIW